MQKEEIINILESDSKLAKMGIFYPLHQGNVGDNIILFLESTYRYLVEIDEYDGRKI